MEKINFENDKSPDLSAETLNAMQQNIEDAIENKNIIMVKTSGNSIITEMTEKKLWLENSEVLGNKLNLDSSNSEIVIGEGVSKILISAHFQGIISQVDTSATIRIKKNNSSIITEACCTLDTRYRFVSIAPHLIEVSPGDTISMSFYGAMNQTVTFRDYVITVKVVK